MNESSVVSLARELDIRVAEVRGQLSGNDERILAFVRDHLADLAFHTAGSLAQGAGVSAAAVVRFAHRLGFGSFRELRDHARAELQAAPEAGAAAGSALAAKAERDVESLRLLPRLLEAPLAEAAAALAGARTTWFVANRETHGLAVYAQRLLHQVRPDVRVVDPGFADPLRAVGPEDVVVGITFRPYARLTLELVADARQSGARVVVLTDGQGHPFLDPRDVVLAVPVDSPTLLLSFVPAVCALEALAAAVARLDADTTHDTLEATARFAERRGLLQDPPLRMPPA